MAYPKMFLIHAFIIALIVQACIGPDPLTELSTEEKDVIVTTHDQSIDFSAYKTYAIVDSVRVISKNSNDTLKSKSSYSDLILKTINDQLQKFGYTKVGRTGAPDAGINVSVLRFSEQVPMAYFGSPGYGYYGYPTTAFWGYPGYQYGFQDAYGYYQIDIGSVSIEMIDIKSARASHNTQTLNVIWRGLLAGSITDSAAATPDRITRGLIGAFDQSPYLNTRK